MRIALALSVEMNFERAMEHCDNLIVVHKRSGSVYRGPRRAEMSINRAVVMIAIASWQAVVQDMTKFLLKHNMPDASDPNFGVARLISGQVTHAVNSFSTPNAENTRKLLSSVGFDPRPFWTWSQGNRRTAVALTPSDVEQELRDWLRLRHAIAHGDEKLPQVAVLQAVRAGKVDKYHGPSIRLADAERCIAFIRKLAEVTIAGLVAEHT